MRRFCALLMLVALLLVACATPYQPLTELEGFTDRQLDDGTWEVRFQANARTSLDQARRLALRRAGDLGVEQDQRYVEVLDETWAVDVSYVLVERYGILTEGVIPVPGGVVGIGGMSDPQRIPERMERPSVTLTVRYHRLQPSLPEGPLYPVDDMP